MKTITLGCGCSISSSMYGVQEILSVILCTFHALLCQEHMERVQDIVLKTPAPEEKI